VAKNHRSAAVGSSEITGGVEVRQITRGIARLPCDFLSHVYGLLHFKLYFFTSHLKTEYN